MAKGRTYGEFVIGPTVQAERADRILGARVELDAQGRPDQVAIQFQTTAGFRELGMDFVEALFILSVLKCIQLDTRTNFPDDPRTDRDHPLC